MDSDLRLKGVHHTARPTWKLKETVEFYRDKMGLPLVHVIAARGWGPDDHPDFLHFFFESLFFTIWEIAKPSIWCITPNSTATQRILHGKLIPAKSWRRGGRSWKLAV